ncbi:MAG: hypothetical protein ACR2O4_00460 [Hyphomicrobiaceae bacterium]
MAHFLTVVIVGANVPAPVELAENFMRAYFSPDLALSPDAKCDGYTIGGRYDGMLFGKEQNYNLTPSEFESRYGFDAVRQEDNAWPVAGVISDILPFAVIAPDGAWFDRDNKPDEQWRKESLAILEEYPDHLAVAFDCHC